MVSINVARSTTRFTALRNFISVLEIANFDRNTVIHYGLIRSELEKGGKIIGANDLLIVAHATSLNVRLVTNNPKEFARVDDLILYKKYCSLSVAAANISRTCSEIV